MIILQDVDYAYTKTTSVFSKLSLKLEAGKIYGLLGKNGVGKSTLLKLIAGGLIPKQGTIRMGDYNPSNRKPQMYERLFYLPEDMAHIHLSIPMYVKAHAGFYPDFDSDLLYEILHTLEVDPTATIKNLSYGQTKKFYLAFGLACKTQYVILDEPTNGLDIPSKAKLRKVLASNLRQDQIYTSGQRHIQYNRLCYHLG